MKEGIHPKWYPDAKVICACGNTWTVGATVPETAHRRVLELPSVLYRASSASWTPKARSIASSSAWRIAQDNRASNGQEEPSAARRSRPSSRWWTKRRRPVDFGADAGELPGQSAYREGQSSYLLPFFAYEA